MTSFPQIRKTIVLNFLHYFKRNFSSSNNKNIRLEVGASVQIQRSFSKKEVEEFARLTQDFNPIHLDESEAVKRNFEKPVVHGALINGVISSVIGTILPGQGSILLEQELHFPNPLFIDENFTTTIKISNRKRNIYYCHYECCTIKDGKKVTEGMAKILFRP